MVENFWQMEALRQIIASFCLINSHLLGDNKPPVGSSSATVDEVCAVGTSVRCVHKCLKVMSPPYGAPHFLPTGYETGSFASLAALGTAR